MKIVDANVVLRYLLADIPELSAKSSEILEKGAVYLPFEIIAEIVYVFEKHYRVGRKEISDSIITLLKYNNISSNDTEIAVTALKIFGDTKLDIVDTFVYAYNKIRGFEVASFDKELNKYIKMN